MKTLRIYAYGIAALAALLFGAGTIAWVLVNFPHQFLNSICVVIIGWGVFIFVRSTGHILYSAIHETREYTTRPWDCGEDEEEIKG